MKKTTFCAPGMLLPGNGRFLALIASAAVLVIALLGQNAVEAQDTTAAPPAGPTVAPPAGPTVAPPAGPTVAPPNPQPPATGQTAAPIEAYLGDMCMNSQQCTTKVLHSECMDSGDNTGATRCRCLVNYYAYNILSSGKKEDFRCGVIVTTFVKPECSACENNGGTCVLRDDGLTIFCQCPISQTGAACEVIHVNVSCSMQAMTICYSPHPQVNFTDGWMMYASGQSRTPQCVGSVVTQTSQLCAASNEQLALSLNSTDIKTCGTTVIENSRNKRYMNTIELQKFDSSGKANDSVTPIVFNVYCSFTAFQDQTFPGIGVGRVNGNDRGSQVNPNITIQVTDQFGRTIAQGTTLLVGDSVKFVVAMNIDVNYVGLQVMRCTASTSPVIPDSTAETRALTNNGCPVPGEVTGPSWYWTGATLNNRLVVTSGSVPIFKLSSSNDVYFHCALKLCMTGDLSCVNSNKVQCDAQKSRRKRDESSVLEEQTLILSRQKRATSSIDVQTSLRVEDPNALPSSKAGDVSVGSPAFIALLIILAIIALVLVGVIVVTVVRARRRNSASNYGEPRPQLFALPRINRTHERF